MNIDYLQSKLDEIVELCNDLSEEIQQLRTDEDSTSASAKTLSDADAESEPAMFDIKDVHFVKSNRMNMKLPFPGVWTVDFIIDVFVEDDVDGELERMFPISSVSQNDPESINLEVSCNLLEHYTGFVRFLYFK